MREIKFRIFNKHTKSMIYDTKMAMMNMFENGFKTEDEHRYLIQYTGLKDKNGKEIYEGDIVETDLGKGVVVFDSAAFLIRILEDDEYYGFEDFFSLHEGGCYLVEVIGNIFQDDDLLRGVYFNGAIERKSMH